MNKYYQVAQEFDKHDKLSSFCNCFINTDDQSIYLDGNSLGKLPKKTIPLTNELIRYQWGGRLIRSWSEKWLSLSEKIASKIARIIGAKDDEVFVGDTTSVNLYKLAYATLYKDKSRKKIISDSLNFPTDLYIIQGLIKQQFKNHSLKIVKSSDGIGVKESDIKKELDENTALLALSYVVYKSAFMYNMERINSLAHKENSLVIWDLSHAVGAVPIHLNETNADMAVGCTYKYLNGGPGSPAFLYVRKDLQKELINPIWAWFSHDSPFDFNLEYKASDSIQRFATGSPSIISLAAIEPGLDLILEAGIKNLRAKSVLQSKFFLELINKFLLTLGFTIASPLDEDKRGSHISIKHQEGYRITRAMVEPQDNAKIIIPDFRPPNNIRLGIAPLYNTYTDIFECVKKMCAIVKEKKYMEYEDEKL